MQKTAQEIQASTGKACRFESGVGERPSNPQLDLCRYVRGEVCFVCCIYTHVGQVYKRISCMNSRSPAEPYSARLWTDSLFWNNVIAQLSHVILRMTQSDVFR